MKVQKGWKELKAEVIDTDACCVCGNCVAFCDNLEMTASGPVEKDGDLCAANATCRDGHGLCYNLCPMTGRDVLSTAVLDRWVHGEPGRDKTNEFRHGLDVVAARSILPTLNGRAVSGAGSDAALLVAAMREGIIDGVVFSSLLRAGQVLVGDEQGIIEHASDGPVAFAPMAMVGKAMIAGRESLAVVGSGCEIQALRKLQNHPSFDLEAHELVSLALGTFCFFKPRPDRLSSFLARKGLSLENIHRLEPDGKAFWHAIHDASEIHRVPASELYACSKGSCPSCMDGTASLADLSIGHVHALPGWDVVIPRTSRGKEVLAAAIRRGVIETKPLNPVLLDLVLEVTRDKLCVCEITGIADVARGIKTFTFHAPEIARRYHPGQFIVLWLPDVDFLPMGISNVSQGMIQVTVQEAGDGTRQLFRKVVGETVGIRGPYGKGWDLSGDDFLLVGGGVGVAALATARDLLIKNGKRVTSLVGGRTRDHVFCSADQDTCILTDDGSLGEQGLVTDAVASTITGKEIKHILTCGPEAMMRQVFDIGAAHGARVQASLERMMKCCVGLCGSCCVGKDNDVPVCKLGPVFDHDTLATLPQFGAPRK